MASVLSGQTKQIHQVERLTPPMLKTNNLETNKSKTEKCNINVKKRNNESWNWKKCKYVGSRLDTKTDKMEIKILMTTNYAILENFFRSKHISKKLKIKLFTTHIECIFLYNSELWTLTKTQQIDSFHPGMLRKVIGIHWPERTGI